MAQGFPKEKVAQDGEATFVCSDGAWFWSMTTAELHEQSIDLEKALAEEVGEASVDPGVCPFCGSDNVGMGEEMAWGCADCGGEYQEETGLECDSDNVLTCPECGNPCGVTDTDDDTAVCIGCGLGWDVNQLMGLTSSQPVDEWPKKLSGDNGEAPCENWQSKNGMTWHSWHFAKWHSVDHEWPKWHVDSCYWLTSDGAKFHVGVTEASIQNPAMYYDALAHQQVIDQYGMKDTGAGCFRYAFKKQGDLFYVVGTGDTTGPVWDWLDDQPDDMKVAILIENRVCEPKRWKMSFWGTASAAKHWGGADDNDDWKQHV